MTSFYKQLLKKGVFRKKKNCTRCCFSASLDYLFFIQSYIKNIYIYIWRLDIRTESTKYSGPPLSKKDQRKSQNRIARMLKIKQNTNIL